MAKINKNRFIFAAGLAALIFLSGCATLIGGSKQKVPVTSTPPGATVKVDGTESGLTPVVLRLRRSRDHTIEISKDGYKSATVTLNHVISGATCGNVLLGGILGIAIDGCTGSLHRLAPGKVDVKLEKAEK